MSKKSLRANYIVSAVILFAIVLITGIIGDYYFDLNDDCLMKDILSGAYTGVPGSHNIQMLYPISAFISVFYRIFAGADWYGIFLCACQYLCIFIICHRTVAIFDRNAKALVGILVMIVSVGLIGPHLLYVQYTFTCGLLSATAAYIILTHHKDGVKDLALSVILIFVAYLLRSEMLLLTLPMVYVAILIKWINDKNNFKRYFITALSIALAVLIGFGANKIGYSDPQWQEFYRLFDARTELYDFQYIPEYEGNEEFYESIGLSESEQKLLINYNYGLDEEINADTLSAIAKYASDTRSYEKPFSEKLSEALKLYLYRLRYVSKPKSYQYPMTDFPWNMAVLCLYITIFFMGLFPIAWVSSVRQKLLITGQLLLLFACRSTLWLYILIRGRDPIRITHPLYIMEILILLGMLMFRYIALGKTNCWNQDRDDEEAPDDDCDEDEDEEEQEIEGESLRESINKNPGKEDIAVLTRMVPMIAIMGLFASLIMGAVDYIPVIRSENAARQAMRVHYDALNDYFNENPDSFYFVDVYTSVSVAGENPEEATYSEKMFKNVDNSLQNHDICGGWATFSPLFRDKLAAFGYSNIETALLTDNAYFVQDINEPTDWLVDYYAEKGVSVTIEQQQIVGDVFGIYKLSRSN